MSCFPLPLPDDGCARGLIQTHCNGLEFHNGREHFPPGIFEEPSQLHCIWEAEVSQPEIQQLPITASAPTNPTCRRDEDCSLLGNCTAGTCLCDKGWKGTLTAYIPYYIAPTHTCTYTDTYAYVRMHALSSFRCLLYIHNRHCLSLAASRCGQTLPDRRLAGSSCSQMDLLPFKFEGYINNSAASWGGRPIKVGLLW